MGNGLGNTRSENSRKRRGPATCDLRANKRKSRTAASTRKPATRNGKEGAVGSSPTPGFIRTALRREFRGVCPRCEAVVNHLWATDWATSVLFGQRIKTVRT